MYYNPPSGQPATSGTNIGSVSGNGTIVTLSSTPLALTAKTTTTRLTRAVGKRLTSLPSMCKSKESKRLQTPARPPRINGGGFGGGLGEAMTVGDFNCDGYPDLAVGIPFGTFTQPLRSLMAPGTAIPATKAPVRCAIYYGSANWPHRPGHEHTKRLHLTPGNGITPVTAPTGKNPLLIPNPLAYNYAYGGAQLAPR